MGAAGAAPAATKALADAASHDGYALVREAALHALGTVDAKSNTLNARFERFLLLQALPERA